MLETFQSHKMASASAAILGQLHMLAESIPASLTLLLASAVLGSYLRWSKRSSSTFHLTKPLPPSPGRALPVIGHMHLLRGGDPRQMFASMRRELGDIFSFYAGNRLIVVLNGYDMIREALVNQADVFSHRAHTFMADQMGHRKGIVSSSGKVWREQRKITERALRAQGWSRASNIGERIQTEIDDLMDCLEVYCQNQQPVDPQPLILASISNIMMSLIYGHRFSLNDPKYKMVLTALSNCLENFGNTEPLNFFPVVRFVPGDPFRFWACMRNKDILEKQFVIPEVEEHERKISCAEDENDDETMEISSDEDDVLPPSPIRAGDDVLSAYLREMTRKTANDTPTTLDKENLVKVADDLLAAGGEVPCTATVWLLLYMVRFPEIQERCYQEIIENLSRNRVPTLDDRSSLPYVEATIWECLRHADIAALALAHGLSRDTELRNYSLPQDAIVLVNLNSVHHDPSVWTDPEVFRPERFIGPDGKVCRLERFAPFSMGPRSCPGEQLSRMELFLYLTSILYRYRLRHDGPSPPSLKGDMTMTHRPPHFKMLLEHRQ